LKESWKRAEAPPRVPTTKYIGSFSESGGSRSPAASPVSVCTASPRRATIITSVFEG
jgi:hypothetical protein